MVKFISNILKFLSKRRFGIGTHPFKNLKHYKETLLELPMRIRVWFIDTLDCHRQFLFCRDSHIFPNQSTIRPRIILELRTRIRLWFIDTTDSRPQLQKYEHPLFENNVTKFKQSDQNESRIPKTDARLIPPKFTPKPKSNLHENKTKHQHTFIP